MGYFYGAAIIIENNSSLIQLFILIYEYIVFITCELYGLWTLRLICFLFISTLIILPFDVSH